MTTGILYRDGMTYTAEPVGAAEEVNGDPLYDIRPVRALRERVDIRGVDGSAYKLFRLPPWEARRMVGRGETVYRLKARGEA